MDDAITHLRRVKWKVRLGLAVWIVATAFLTYVVLSLGVVE